MTTDEGSGREADRSERDQTTNSTTSQAGAAASRVAPCPGYSPTSGCGRTARRYPTARAAQARLDRGGLSPSYRRQLERVRDTLARGEDAELPRAPTVLGEGLGATEADGVVGPIADPDLERAMDAYKCLQAYMISKAPKVLTNMDPIEENRQTRARLAKAAEMMPRRGEVRVVDGGVTWLVPSRTRKGFHRVTRKGREWFCDCKDYARRAKPCWHILYRMASEGVGPLPEPQPKKKRPPVPQDWPSYDTAQRREVPLFNALLRGVVDVAVFPHRLEHAPGRPRIPLADQLYHTIQKVYSGFGNRRSEWFRDMACEAGHLDRVSNYKVPSRLLMDPGMTPLLEALISMTALPLTSLEDGEALAFDGTGMSTVTYFDWSDEKPGDSYPHEIDPTKRRWWRLHLMVGTRTHVVVAAKVTEQEGEGTGEKTMFAPLLRQAVEIGFRPGSVVADGGLLSKANYAVGQELGIDTYIPFPAPTPKRRSRGLARGAGGAAWKRAWHFYQDNREAFLAKYHRRSNVEAVIGAIKRKLGERVKHRDPIAQVNEILCKLVAYNLTVLIHEMHEHGVSPSFIFPEWKGGPHRSPPGATTAVGRPRAPPDDPAGVSEGVSAVAPGQNPTARESI